MVNLLPLWARGKPNRADEEEAERSAMEFGDLPLELRLKIFSYLPQHTLLTITDVSREWKELAFDPLLWTKVKISLSLGMTRIVEILERATLLRSLHIFRSATARLRIIAPYLPRFCMLGELIIQKDALWCDVMLEALKNCPSLSAIVLLGDMPLADREVAVLSTVPNLKSLVLSEDVRVPDELLHQISRCCPELRRLEYNSDHIPCISTLAALSRLQHLTCLSVTSLCKDALPFVSVNCTHLEYLHIGALKNAHGATETAKLGEFLGLRCVTINSRCEENWFSDTSPDPASLKCFGVPEMRLEMRELQLMLRNRVHSIRHIEFNALRLAWSVLDVLSVCLSLESLHIYGLSGKNFCLSALRKFPKLVRASLNADESATGALQQLPSMVDVFSHATSPLDGARLVLNVFCSSQTSHDPAMAAVCAFKDFIVSNTHMPKELIQDTERRGDISWQRARRTVTARFPPVIETLKLLEVNLGVQ